MAFMKTGFILGPGGNATGIGDFLRALNGAGIPYFLKSMDAMPLEAQEIARDSNVPHTAVYRRSVPYAGAPETYAGTTERYNPDLPDYRKSPLNAAIEHWGYHLGGFPPELDPAIVWTETVNEPAQHFEFASDGEVDIPVEWGRERIVLPDGTIRITNAEWLAEFATHTANLAMADGYKWAAFGWSGGEPEPNCWRGPNMISFLRLASRHPDQLAVALHEYSFELGYLVGDGRYHVGRFRDLLAACQENGIPHPTVFITEFGWTNSAVPAPDVAMTHLLEAGEMYAQYPTVRGAGIWYLGPGFGNIANQAQRLIAPLQQLTLSTTFPDTAPDPLPETGDCPAITPGASTAIWIPKFRDLTDDELTQVVNWAENGFELPDGGHTFGEHMLCPSHVDALVIHRNGLSGSVLAVAFPHKIGTGVTEEWILENCPCAFENGKQVVFLGAESGNFAFTNWPTEAVKATQWFAANPQNYIQFGLPGHDGLDITAPTGAPVFAAAAGTVYRVETDPTVSNYGIHVRIAHRDGWKTIYAHLQQAQVAVGDQVSGGQQIGRSNNTGNSFGSHLHFGVKKDGETYIDENGHSWPSNLHDPWPLLRGVVDAYLDQRGTAGWAYASSIGLNLQGGHGRASGDLNLRAAASAGAARLGIIPTSSIMRITGSMQNGYYPVVAVVTNASVSPALIGLHASADPGNLYGGTVEYEEFKALHPGVIKVLSAHSAESVRRLAYDNPGTTAWIIRAFLSFQGRETAVTPQQFFDWTWPDTQRTINALIGANVPANAIRIELHNEPNLVQEGWGVSWGNGHEFGVWLQDVTRLHRQVIPAGVQLVYPGLSPGGDVTSNGIPIRTDSYRFLNDSAFALSGLDALAVHCYWSNNWPMQLAYDHLDWHNSFNKPLWVTEASRNDRPPTPPLSDAQYAAEYVTFWRGLQARPLARGVMYFVASASDSYYAPECWVLNGRSRGIAAEIRRLIG